MQARNGTLTVDDPAFQAGVEDVVTQLDVARAHEQGHRPARRRQRGADLRGPRLRARSRSASPTTRPRSTTSSTPSLAATAAAQRAHPDLRIEQFGDASADKALSASLDDDFQRAEFLSLPITLLILIVAFGALVAAGVPLLLAITAVIATLGLVGPDQPVRADGGVRELA